MTRIEPQVRFAHPSADRRAAGRGQTAAEAIWRLPAAAPLSREPTRAGQHVRGAAGALLAVRHTLPSETRQVLALLAQLQSLAATVARLREAQGRAAQSAAARAAAEHLAVAARRQAQQPPAATLVDLLSVPSRVTALGPAHRPAARSR